MNIVKKLSLLVLLAGFSASSVTAFQTVETSDQLKKRQEAIKKAIEDPKRSKRYLSFDKLRKPEAVLEFSMVKPGMTVIDINAGSGYYSEILASYLGPNGKVIAHNGPLYLSHMHMKRGNDHPNFPNLTFLKASSEALTFPENTFDMAFMILAYHDYYFTSDKGHTGERVENINKSILKALKPGASLIIVDHHGPPNTTDAQIDHLHRIDANRLRRELERDGFQFAGLSPALEHKDDIITKTWFEVMSGYTTSRFIFRFIKKK